MEAYTGKMNGWIDLWGSGQIGCRDAGRELSARVPVDELPGPAITYR